MAYDLQKFSSGSLDKGISARTMDFQGEIVLDISSYNVSQGIQQGLGPRPGMSTIPGQADAETIAGTRLPGLRASEGQGAEAPAQGLDSRLKVLGVYAIKLPDPADVTQKITTYAWLVTSLVTDASTVEYFDIVLSSTLVSTLEQISSNIYDGFGDASASFQTSAVSVTHSYFDECFVPKFNGSGVNYTVLREFLTYSGTNYVSSIVMSVTGANIPTQWLYGEASAVGDATHAPSSAFHIADNMHQAGAAAVKIFGGVPSEYNLQNFTTTPRDVKVFALDINGGINIQYSVSYTPTTSIMKQDIKGLGTVTLDLSAQTATKDTAGVTYANTKGTLVNDPLGITNSSYKAILVAAKNPLACLFQDAYRDAGSGKTNQWFDVTQNSFQPRTFLGSYTEDTVSTRTAFRDWPAFVRETPMGTSTGVSLGAANTGILRANTVYEFTYSLYNKRLNFETNVGKCVKIQTGTDEWLSLQLWVPGGGRTTIYESWTLGGGNDGPVPPIFYYNTSSGPNPTAVGYGNFMNHLQYRFYYRQEGTFEWLPALFMDMAQYWFYPHTQLVACTGAIAALPGGQPGAFNDYSPLAKDNYTCVVQYKDRAFWFSDKQVNFSLRNNIFAYPGRNSISAVAGEFKGGILHNYPGQAEQSSRLIIFGTRETYVARFTGDKQQANVQVSADTSAVFDIDGSDLVIDPWTSVTAFSYRSAAVAEGILYWWGPQGIFRDDGVQTPTRISADLEPNLFTIYDPNKTSEIVANYNNQTKELEWIFTPKTLAADGEVNTSLIFNTISGNWTRGKYKQQIDWLQSVTVDTNVGTAGFREVVGTRLAAVPTVGGATQRAYYFDQRNRSGDLAPTKDFVVKQVSTPSTGLRRLTLADGLNTSFFATIVVGDYIALQQTTSYSGLAAATDMIARVAAINSGGGTIDITLPTGAVLPNGSLTFDQYFPFWHQTPVTAGLNGIPYNLATNYWLPAGIGGYFFWLYCYLLSKIHLWATNLSLGWTIGYRTPTASATITDFIAFADNSDGNFQVYHPLRPGNDNHEGQGIKFTISGNHIGHEWVLQYLEAHATPIKGDPLKRFEG